MLFPSLLASRRTMTKTNQYDSKSLSIKNESKHI